MFGTRSPASPRSQPNNPTRNEAESLVGPELLAGIGEQLQSQADSENGRAARNGLAEWLRKTVMPETVHPILERAHTGQHQGRGALHVGRGSRDPGLRTDVPKRGKH